ncbi:MAG: GIY-YIG nuclease family protein [Vicingaceae bacterium]|nr:GIY-YIG nuclease family protein [Vicingaceae bacterium]
MLNFFKKKNNKIVSDSVPQQEKSNSLNIYFDYKALPKDKRTEKIYLDKWLRSDGDWIEEGQPLYTLRIGERIGIGLAFRSQPIKAEKSGVIQLLKKKEELILDNDIICILHPKGKYESENIPSKESYSFYFDKFKYNISENYAHHPLKIKEWYKEDGDKVSQNELILTLKYSTSYGNNETLNHYAEKDGYLDKARTYPDTGHEVNDRNDLDQNELIYIIHENDINRIERKFVNTPNIINDDFTNKKIIKWKQVGNNNGYSEGITTKSIDNKIDFTFSLNNIEEKDFIVFQFYSKELMLSKDDVVSFLFNDNKIIDFKINNSSYKSSHPHIDKLFENKVLITESELNIFETQEFLKWKITLNKQNREIIGGNEGYKIYLSHNNLAIVTRKFTKEYRELVRNIVPNYEPLLERENAFIDNPDFKSEECYVYLMIDTVNNFHKIGISNSPEWREKTLQSEKPSIELIASKKFVSRNIASSIEKALHSTFADKRLRGEWFQLEPRDIEEIKITLSS